MRSSLGIMAAIGAAGVLGAAWVMQSTATRVGGIEEAVALQETLCAAYDHLVEPQPPLMVYRVPGSPEWPGFRWKVEATLRPGWKPGSPEVKSALARLVARAVATRVQERGPSGVMVLLHAAGQPDATLLYDAEGRPFDPAAKRPAPAAGSAR